MDRRWQRWDKILAWGRGKKLFEKRKLPPPGIKMGSIQTDLISSDDRSMVVAHQGNAKSREFLEPQLSVGNDFYDTPEMRCKMGLDAKVSW